jgi:hypothetical protein
LAAINWGLKIFMREQGQWREDGLKNTGSEGGLVVFPSLRLAGPLPLMRLIGAEFGGIVKLIMIQNND